MLIPASWSALSQILAVGLFLFVQQFTALSTEQLERMLEAAFVDAMHRAQLSMKEMAYALRIDAEQLRRQISPAHPHQHLSVQRLLDYAPFPFLKYFGPSLIYIAATRRWNEIEDAAPVPEREMVG